MERLDGSSAIPSALRGGIVALGNFDGFHKGHQAVVGLAVSRARIEGKKALVATFDPHPMRYFRPDSEPFELTTLEQRERLVREAGADALLVFQFDAAFADQTPAEFVTEWLGRQLDASGVVTGNDFTFGKNRAGDVDQLKLLGHSQRMSVQTAAPVLEGERIVSSTWIREALRDGDCATAAQLLTRPFAITGTVQHGDRRGRKLGFPTANIALGDYLRPRYGVYAVRGRTKSGKMLDGVASLGVRPMFEPMREWLEPHFFDFKGNLYNRELEVELHSFIREEMVFEEIEGLKRRMAIDALEARRRLARLAPAA